MVEIFAYAVFGLIVGSFLNVVILRNGVQTLGGRSVCMSCGQKISWFDLLPLVSWILLRGRCRACSARISIQYPLVELSTAILFACIGASQLSFLLRALGLPIAGILLAVAVYDMRHTIIPDTWAYAFGILAFAYSVLAGGPENSNFLVLVIAGPLAALPLFFLWFISKGRWMGLGDAKLALGIGWLLGPLYGEEAILLAFVLGAFIGVSLVFLPPLWQKIMREFIPHSFWYRTGRGLTMKSEMPFGPFLVAACLIVWFSLMYSIPIPFLWQL